MDDAGWSLSETTLPELTDQHRIRLKEEELSGLESVHMAESETECTAPGLNTLEPECVIAHSGVSDVHHTHASLIKTETDLGSTHTGDLIKTENLDSTELEYLTHLHPDQIKTETEDGGYLKLDHIRDLQNVEPFDIKCGQMKCESNELTELEYLSCLHPDQIKTEADDGGYLKAEHSGDWQEMQCFDIKSDPMKCEPSERLGNDLMDTEMTGAGDNQAEPRQNAGGPNPNCKKEETHDLLISCGDSTHHCDKSNGNIQSTIVQKRMKSYRERQRITDVVEPMIMSSSENQRSFKSNQNKTLLRDKCEAQAASKPHNCTQCEKSFRTKPGLKKHQRIHVGDEVPNTSNPGSLLQTAASARPHKCALCGTGFSQLFQLNKHKRIHTGEKPHKCPQCGMCFSQTYHLKRHQTIHTGERPHACSECEKRFRTDSGLRQHLKVHAGEKPFKCTHCEKCFITKLGLNEHLRTHTGEKPYVCTQCAKGFSHKSSLDHHQRIHTGEKPYECSQCGKCYSRKTRFIEHQRTHTGERPYKCSICEKCFFSRLILNQHMRSHAGESPHKCSRKVHAGAPFKCPHCEKCFGWKAGLKQHLRTHTGEKPYKCSQCPKCFSHVSSLNHHERIHAGEKSFKCSHCEKCFFSRHNLKRHQKSHERVKARKR